MSCRVIFVSSANASAFEAIMLTGIVTWVLLLSVVISIPLSLGLLTLYRRAVRETMLGLSPGAPTPADAAPPVWTGKRRGNRVQPVKAVLERSPTALTEEMLGHLSRRPWRNARIYGIAGAAYAVTLAVCTLVVDGRGINGPQLLHLSALYFWPVIMAAWLVAAVTLPRRIATTAGYALAFVVLSMVLAARSNGVTWMQLVLVWLWWNGPATVLVMLSLHRSIRAVAPMVLAFVALALAGSNAALLVVTEGKSALAAVSALAATFGLNAITTVAALVVTGLIAWGALGWVWLLFVRSQYTRKRISDQTLTVDALWLVFALVHGLLGANWLPASLVAFAAYKAVCRIGFELAPRDGPEATRLLLLRAFSIGRGSERLYDVLSTHWRSVGPISLIAGPDLASRTIEPHEFMDFLNRRIDRLFIGGLETLEARLESVDEGIDVDGRYRVNEFFCYDDLWRDVFSRLAPTADAVLMDLRGFSRRNVGCVFEVEELSRRVPLARVIFLEDESTDMEFLGKTIEESVGRGAPAVQSEGRSAEPRTLKYEGDRSVKSLLQALAAAAGSA